MTSLHSFEHTFHSFHASFLDKGYFMNSLVEKAKVGNVLSKSRAVILVLSVV